MHLPHTTLHAEYRVTRPFRVPYHAGSMIHGALGQSLLSLACRAPTLCSDACADPAHCAIPRLYKPAPRPDVPTAVRFGSAENPPPPVIPLIPPEGGQSLDPGAEFAFGLRCFGTLPHDHLDLLLAALERFADRPLTDEGGRVELVRTSVVGRRHRVLDVGTAPAGQGMMTMEIETPLWLLHDKRLAVDLDFPTLFRAAWRRLAVLSALYGEESPDDDALFHELDALAPQVSTTRSTLRALSWERRSDLKDQRHPMEGLVGSIGFSGPLGAFRPILAASELCHLGKSTSFGLGRVCWRGTFVE